MADRIAIMARRAAPAGRHAPGGLRDAGQPVRRPVHRHAADEHRRRRRVDGGTSLVGDEPPVRRSAGARRRPSRSSSASGPSTCASTATAPVQGIVRQVEWLGHEALLGAAGGRRRPAHELDRCTAADEDDPPDPGPTCASASTGPVHLVDRRSTGARLCERRRPTRARSAIGCSAATRRRSPTPVGCARRCIALAFLAPSLVIFVVFFFYPFEQLVLRGLYRNNAAGTNLRYVGWEQYARRPHRRRLPRGPLAQRPVRALHGAGRPRARHRAGRRRQPAAARHQDLPDDLLLDRSPRRSRWRRSSSSSSSTRRSACSRSAYLASATSDPRPSHGAVRRVALVDLAEPRPVVHHRPRRPPGHPRRGRRGGHPRRLRPGPALLPHHAAAASRRC